MHLIACIDSRGGMSFCGKRQSMDSVLRADIINTTEGPIFMSEYSARQFENEERIAVSDAAPEDGIYFIENIDATPLLENAEKITLYCWNRAYPFDNSFPLSSLENGWSLAESVEFVGSSHDKITKEVWTR